LPIGLKRHINSKAYLIANKCLRLYWNLPETKNNKKYAYIEMESIVKDSRKNLGAPVNDISEVSLKYLTLGEFLDYANVVKLIHPIQRIHYINGIEKYISIPMDLVDKIPKLTKEHKGRLYFPYEQKLERQKWQDGLKQNHKEQPAILLD